MKKNRINTIDVQIGQHVKSRRIELGLSQTHVAQKLGVSFQQVQKYENGHSRIAAGTLYQIAEILGVHISAFFPGREPVYSGATLPPQYLGVLWSLHATRNPKVQKKVSQLLTELNKNHL
jgi:transcriptional regulator with XRE-family HTH domain